jgi:hypothetical protein
MANRSAKRFRIANVMLVIAAVAVVLGMMLWPGSESVLFASLLFALGMILFWVAVILRIIELIFGVPCPGCGGRKLERRNVEAFGERFFLCPDCGVRCRRNIFGMFGPFFWKDASAPEFDVHYQKPVVEDPWNAPPGLEDEDETVTSKTHANLVRNKRLRRPENPNGPGLE